MNFDVVICGYGPTGAVAANLLGQQGVRVLVVERSEEIYDIPRAVHFDGEVARILQSLGLSDAIDATSSGGKALAFLNGAGRVLLSANVEEMPALHGWPIGNFFNQPLLEAQLREAAKRFDTVEVRLGWELETLETSGSGVRLGIRRRSDGAREGVEARFLLGCDGASSKAREGVGIELEDLGCDEPWLVCDVLLDEGFEIDRTGRQICDWRRPTTLVPCEGRHIRWEFMLRPGDEAADLESESTTRAMMAPHLHLLAPGLRPEQGKLIRSKVYTFHGLVAKRWRVGPVFVLGDAAHQTPPFLGQGLCAGVRDAYNLCWKLAGVLEGRFHDALLDTYESERHPHAHAVVAQAIRTGRVIQTTSRWRAFLRDAYFALGRLAPLLQRPFRWAPAWTLGPGLFDGAVPTAEGATGHPIDQPWVGTPAGARARLDDVLGSGFSLVGLGVDPHAVVDADTASTLEGLGARFVEVRAAEDAGGAAAVVDVDGGLAAWCERVRGGRVAIVRPDRQVFGVYAGDGDALAAALREGVARLARGLGSVPARDVPASPVHSAASR